MSDSRYILAEIRNRFDTWNRTNYHNRTIAGDEHAWAAWRAAILIDRQKELTELEPEDYQAVRPKHWLRKEIAALKKSLGS